MQRFFSESETFQKRLRQHRKIQDEGQNQPTFARGHVPSGGGHNNVEDCIANI